MLLIILATRYHPTPHSAGGGLLATFVHSLVASLAWHAGSSIARLLGGWLVVMAVIVGVCYLVSRVRQTPRRPARRGRGRRR